MDGEEVFFRPYGIELLEQVLRPRIEQAFREGVVSEAVLEYGVKEAARRWGDIRNALRLFRQAGETAMECGLDAVARECLDVNIGRPDKEAVTEKLLVLPFNHFPVLTGMIGWTEQPGGEIEQPIATGEVVGSIHEQGLSSEFTLGERAVRELITDLETMGLLYTWIESRGRQGRVKQIETAFDPQWVDDAMGRYLAETSLVDPDALMTETDDK